MNILTISRSLRIAAILLLLSLPLGSARAQHFAWAASAGNIDIAYRFSAVTADNAIVAGGEASRNYTHEDQPEIYDATGSATQFRMSADEMDIVVSYTSEGKINWYKTFDKRRSVLEGIAADDEGNIYLLQNIYPTLGNGVDYKGMSPEWSGKEMLDPGHYVVCLDKTGKLQWMDLGFSTPTVIKGRNLSSTLEISEFKCYPGGGFVVCGHGHSGKICNEAPDTLAGAAGIS